MAEQKKGQIQIFAKNIKGNARGGILEESKFTRNIAGGRHIQNGGNGVNNDVNQPRKEALRVVKVEGPFDPATNRKVDIIEKGKRYNYRIVQYSRTPTDEEKKQIKWGIRYDDGGIAYAPNVNGLENMSFFVSDSHNVSKVRVYAFFRTPSETVNVVVPVSIELIDVTTNTGKYLFSLKPNDKHKAQKVTVKNLYVKGLQWFCPFADNYLEFIKKDKNLHTFSELKHFSWHQIVQFAEVERWNINYRTGGSGDWKASKEGADDYILVSVDGFPYWADAIGQIPFAVDTFTDILEDGYSKDQATKETLAIGQRFGDGKLIGGKKDVSNSYDNHIILRACIWASKRYNIIKERNFWGKDLFTLQKTNYSATHLKTPIDKVSFDKYLKR